MAQNKELLVPAAAKEDSGSFELARVWIANKAQHVSIRVGVWNDPAAWGIMLADLAQHVANAYEQDEAIERSRVLQRIKTAFNAEIDSPTDAPKGG